ncbi:MAG TPA: hypothetical protein VGV59_01175 [Pyrinomonadaceae bacterium]|nr:hypothetical protein [Pyrinomonadaceae bacterium]
MMRMTPNHISFERLAEMAEGRFTAAAGQPETAHLADCRRCADELARLERTIQLMRADTSTDAPRDVLSQTVQMFRARFPRREAASLVKRVMAALTFDSAQLAPAFGVRSGAQTAEARQLLFSAGETDVDLRLASGDSGWTISGQILGECEGGRVEIESVAGGAAAGGEGARADLNELCEFTLPPVPSGSYKLRLHINDMEVEVPELQLR